MGENKENVKDELLNIFVTEEDKNGINPLKMTNYLDIILSNEKSVINRVNTWDCNVDFNGIMGGIANAIKCGYDIRKMSMFIVDTSHFSQDVVDGLKAGTYHIGKSKEVAGNFRPAVLDDKERLVKVVTLKKAINPSEVLTDISNFSMQMSLQEISSQIESVKIGIDRLIKTNRDMSLINPFLYARNCLKNANYKDGDERIRFLNDADKELSEGLVNVESDMKAQVELLSSLKGKQKTLEEVDRCIKFFTEDMALLFRYIGLKYYLLENLKEYERADELLKEYAFFMKDLNTISDNNNYSAFQVIHQYFPYEKENVDFWLTEPQRIIDVLNMRNDLIEKKPKQVIYIDVED